MSMTYHKKVEYMTRLASKLSTAVLDLQTELSELRILLKVEKDIANKEYPGTLEHGEGENIDIRKF